MLIKTPKWNLKCLIFFESMVSNLNILNSSPQRTKTTIKYSHLRNWYHENLLFFFFYLNQWKNSEKKASQAGQWNTEALKGMKNTEKAFISSCSGLQHISSLALFLMKHPFCIWRLLFLFLWALTWMAGEWLSVDWLIDESANIRCYGASLLPIRKC